MSRGSGGLAILIPAAGAAARMRGRDKLLETVRGQPLLADRVAAASTAPQAPGPVLVTLPSRERAPGRWDALEGSGAHLIEVATPGDGLSASLAAGIAALPALASGVMILPADMPDITADDICKVLAAFDGTTILRGATAGGIPGHPVLFPARDFPALATLTGDRGGKALLDAAGARVTLLPLPGDHAVTDLDTPEDWAAWRARNPGAANAKGRA